MREKIWRTQKGSRREEGKKRMMRIQIEIKIGWRRRGE